MRNSTEEIYKQKANQVIDYISAHLHEPLQLDVIANQINVSQRQLLRIMRFSLNEPLSAYVTRQRMERAVMYMQTEEANLVALAGMLGYENDQSFSKSFKKHFGISPKAYLNELQMRLKKGAENSADTQCDLHYDIIEEEDTELVYIRILGKYGEDEPYKIAWDKLVKFLKSNDALSKNTRFIGISFDDPNVTVTNKCRFYACASIQKSIKPTGEFGTLQLRKGRYALYTLKGSCSKLQELYNAISVSYKYTLRQGVAFEEYLNTSQNTAEEGLLTKVFIPIK